MKEASITIGRPHFMHPRPGRIVAVRYLVVHDDDHRARWYDDVDLPDITVTITQEEP